MRRLVMFLTPCVSWLTREAYAGNVHASSGSVKRADDRGR
jgi:hypothetical protein